VLGIYWSLVASRRSAGSPKLRVLKASPDNRSRSSTKRAAKRPLKVPPKAAIKRVAKIGTKVAAKPKGAKPRTTRNVQSANGKPNAVPAANPGDKASGQIGWVIANHVRSRRQEIGLNVAQLAERTGISKGMLSKIENAQTSPSLSTIERLASALDMPLTSLFRGLAEERDAVFVKAGAGPEIVRKGTRAGHTYELLGSLRGPYKRVEPLLVSLDERSEVFPLFQHAGIEILYMLEGVMEYSYGRQLYRMERGDTLQFEGDIPHGPTMLVKLPIRFLSFTIYGAERS
jgi:transcriptional regulator with XRE-family HTH domain